MKNFFRMNFLSYTLIEYIVFFNFVLYFMFLLCSFGNRTMEEVLRQEENRSIQKA